MSNIDMIGQRLYTGRIVIAGAPFPQISHRTYGFSGIEPSALMPPPLLPPAESAIVFARSLFESTRRYSDQKSCWAPNGRMSLSEIPQLKVPSPVPSTKLRNFQGSLLAKRSPVGKNRVVSMEKGGGRMTPEAFRLSNPPPSHVVTKALYAEADGRLSRLGIFLRRLQEQMSPLLREGKPPPRDVIDAIAAGKVGAAGNGPVTPPRKPQLSLYHVLPPCTLCPSNRILLSTMLRRVSG